MQGHTPLGKAQEQRLAHGKEQGICVLSQILGGLMALVPIVIPLKLSPSSCLNWVFWDTQHPVGGALGPMPVRAQVQLLEDEAIAKFWTPAMARALIRQDNTGCNSR